VKDSGIGIPKDKFETIFEEFKQTSSSITREFGGTGLGLPIVKKTLSLMGSDIKVESEINKGSQFSFELSFLIGNEKKIISKKNILKFDDSLKNKKILLVEDNKINQMVAMKFLDQWKCKTMVAENGQIALQLVLQSNFDAILMDLHMPVMNGYEATKKIRDIKEKKFQEIPIIALSASALGEIEVRAKKFGMNDFITKPFKPSELFSSLVRHIKKRK
ncbi:MAG: response regulator, partial [Bacteroidota bacterium]|nr:response regulator [Bacteroidota bacterium]